MSTDRVGGGGERQARSKRSARLGLWTRWRVTVRLGGRVRSSYVSPASSVGGDMVVRRATRNAWSGRNSRSNASSATHSRSRAMHLCPPNRARMLRNEPGRKSDVIGNVTAMTDRGGGGNGKKCSGLVWVDSSLRTLTGRVGTKPKYGQATCSCDDRSACSSCNRRLSRRLDRRAAWSDFWAHF